MIYDLVGDLPSDRFPVFVNVVYFPNARSKIPLGILAIVVSSHFTPVNHDELTCVLRCCKLLSRTLL